MEVNDFDRAMEHVDHHPANTKWQAFMSDLPKNRDNGSIAKRIPEVYRFIGEQQRRASKNSEAAAIRRETAQLPAERSTETTADSPGCSVGGYYRLLAFIGKYPLLFAMKAVSWRVSWILYSCFSPFGPFSAFGGKWKWSFSN